MYFDSHVHSAASPDSDLCPEAAIAALEKQGLGVAFTEHVDFAEHPDFDPDAADAIRGIGDFICDFDIYPAAYKKFRGAGVTLGLEIGLCAAYFELNKKTADDDYDFILGAVHAVDGVELYHALNKRGAVINEPYARALHDPREIDACISRYLNYSREMVELGKFFDAFGHIDYIARYTRLVAENFFYEKFPQEFDALLTALAEREIALEINTKMLEDPRAVKTMQKICRRYSELGGRLCTIGSDAHKTARLGHAFAAAKEIAADARLAVVYFKERKPIRCG